MKDSFNYLNYHLGDDQQAVDFHYEIQRGDTTFYLTETLKFPVKLKKLNAQQASLKALHLALGISYYKIFLPGQITHPYKMELGETEFWNGVFRNGLGEFLYVNKLNPEDLAKFSPQNGTLLQPEDLEVNDSALLGLGGGKDSIVAGELLKSIDLQVSGFVMATGKQVGQTKAVAEAMGVDLLVIERKLDKKLLELQEEPGAFKGHIPISLIFGLVGTALAVATDKKYIVVANEASASIPRVRGEFGAVNHQWSKSFDFEKRLQKYVQGNISPSLTYFSAIRQLTSVGVAKIFANWPQYFEKFTSDNYVFRINPSKRPNSRWSLESPKSLSSFILLAPWISEPEMLRIFGRDFLSEPSLEKLFLELIGLEGEPPLDCVGTVDELILSLNLLANQNKFAGSYLVKLAKTHGVITGSESNLGQTLTLSSDQALPPQLTQKITEKLTAELAK